MPGRKAAKHYLNENASGMTLSSLTENAAEEESPKNPRELL